MVVDEKVGLHGLAEDTLSWVRPGFFSLRYELVGASGVLASIRVHGIGPDKRLLFEMADRRWRIDVFPLSRPLAPIREEETGLEIGTYRKAPEASVNFEDGSAFGFQDCGPRSSVNRLPGGESLFLIEKVESFPKWRAELKLGPEASSLTKLPILFAVACFRLAFN